MAKVICESCGTEFKYEIVKDLDCCPVCGEALWDEGETADSGEEEPEAEETEGGLLYFDEIETSYKERPDFNGVNAYCGECKEFNHLSFDMFDKLVDNEYVVLKDNITVTCEGCGKEHKPRKILYKRKDHYAPPLPRCPVCNSFMLKKISTGSKFLAAATIGMFAIPYNSKTYECKDCGYRF